MSTGSQSNPGPVRRLVERINSLAEGPRIFIYSGTLLLVLTVPIIAFAHRAAIAQGLLLLFVGTVSGLGVVALGYGVVWLFRKSRTRRKAAQRNEAQARQSEADEQQRCARERAELLAAVSAGKSQPLPNSGGLFLRNSEVLWFGCTGSALDRKGTSHVGAFYVTSLRVLFVSPDYPLEIPIDNVNAAQIVEQRLTLIGKTATATQNFLIDDPELAAAHIERTVKAYHRQVDVGFEANSRNIPQDVKTAVWQRDCGRCVECHATDYLEFDHLIPHSKGGASTVENVQLLCRRCNLKKGAAI